MLAQRISHFARLAPVHYRPQVRANMNRNLSAPLRTFASTTSCADLASGSGDSAGTPTLPSDGDATQALATVNEAASNLASSGRQLSLPIAEDSVFWDVFTSVGEGLVMAQQMSGLPWWATIAGAAVSVRLALFPVTWWQIHKTSRLGQTMPETVRLHNMAMLSLQNSVSWTDTLSKWRLYHKGLKCIWRINECHPANMLASFGTHVPIFVSFALSCRLLIENGGSGLEQGGALWFQDLTATDSTLILPLLGSASVYYMLEISFPKTSPKAFLWLKDKIQLFTAVMFPFYTQLPQGVFMYWLTSSSISIAQTYALRSDRFRRVMRLPPTRKPATPPTAAVGGGATQPPATTGGAMGVSSSSK